jgi:branched-chain amino acid transport system substrate-binding protein
VDKIRIGFPVSITGKYSLQGKESLDGIKLWQSEVNSDSGIFASRFNKKLAVELVYFDDKSSEQICKEVTLKLLNEQKVNLFLGPYSSGLTMVIAPIANRLSRIVWNYGGATDEITERGYTNFINAITPSSHYFHGIIDLFANKVNKATKTIAIIFASNSGFSTRVMQGAEDVGLENNFEVNKFGYRSGKTDFSDLVDKVVKLKPDLILGVGRMQDDLNLAKSIIKSGNIPTGNVALIAASIDYFKEVFGGDADGFLSTSQWDKDIELEPDFGPTPLEFHNNFLNFYNKEPNYLAAQAYNIGLIIERCIKESGTQDENSLYKTAKSLDIKTFYGRFKIDNSTGIQIGHKMKVTQWVKGIRNLI